MIVRWLWLLLCAALLLATTTAWRANVFADGQIYFVDADCYSRMERVAKVMAHPFQRIAHHEFENFPVGTEVHTTAPMDWLIALLAGILTPFTPRALDLAGAWISPLLGLAALVVLWRANTLARLRYGHATLLLLAVSPIVVQAFRLGRPDHQSLVLFLIALGLAAEWRLWSAPARRTSILWGAAWGLALWTSLYEPLVVFVLLLILRLALLRAAAFAPAWRIGWAVALGVFVLGTLFDGWRVAAPTPEVARYFPNWSRSIAELAHLSPLSPEFLGWLGWLAPALPVLLAWRFWKARPPMALAMLALLLATYALTCWQIRWGCYLALIAAMALPHALAAIPSTPTAWTCFALSLFPLARQWDGLLYPAPPVAEAYAEQREDYKLLRHAAQALAEAPRAGVIAPWWLCPPLSYWSGQPCVAGSSHESLPGIVDTARFYLAANESEAREILDRRKVGYVVAYEPSRVLATASTLLDEPARRDSLGMILYATPILAPSWLKPIYSNPYFKIYEVQRHGL